MYGEFIFKGNNSQVSTAKFWHSGPKPVSIMLLRFRLNGIFQYMYAPFFLQIGAFSQNFLFKITRKFIFDHISSMPLQPLNHHILAYQSY